MGIPRPKIKNTGSAPKIHLGYLTLITPKQLGLSCPCWKFSTKNFQANNLKSAVKILIYYRIYCRVFIITVLMFSPCYKLDIFMYWTCNLMNNLSSYWGLVDAKIRASDKDLPVCHPVICWILNFEVQIYYVIFVFFFF